MKVILLISLISFFLLSFTGEKNIIDCQKYRNGTFRIEDADAGTIIIKRNGKTQVERQENGVRAIFDVEWVNDCCYILKFRKGLDGFKPYIENMEITVNIVGVTDSSYFLVSTTNYTDVAWNKEAIRVK